ncbi:MAG: acylneuraminate cytidylyltransferase family protein [Desulfobacterales bacterium]|nr:acylneuraminate cytidylyltransferase family protein [Desulfobacterales bacterium]
MRRTSVCIVPVKGRSTRVPGKNFRILNGKPLYRYMLEHILKADCFDAVYVDTDSIELIEYIEKVGIGHIGRLSWLAEDGANGNDLLVHHVKILPGYDCYFQLFITAPFLSDASIKKCHSILMNSEEYDSVFTATEEVGWFWLNGQPVNFRPGILPRSQDAPKVIKETTGLYGITAQSLARYNCRIGASPHIHILPYNEAVDLDSEEDFAYAEYLINRKLI